MQKGQAALLLPQTPEVIKQVERGGHSITFVQVALAILERLAKTVEIEQRDEIRFLEDCLHAGPEQTQLPCDIVSDKGDAAPKMERVKSDVRAGFSETVLRKTATHHDFEEAPKAKPSPPKRKDCELRGSLASREAVTEPGVADAAAMDLLKEGVPWLGSPVSVWPERPLKSESKTKLQKLFDDQFNDWTLDIFSVNAATEQQPLQYVGWEALRRCGCFSEFSLNPAKVSAFLQVAESRYAPEAKTPYHNNIHAADVTQSLWALLTDVGAGYFFDPMDTVVAILSAIVHDMGHDGRNNGFHSNIQDKLALRYNDKSILENFHVSTAFKLFLVMRNTNFIKDLPKAQQLIFRRECIDMVLGTDMAMHFKMVGEFRDHTAKLGQDKAEWFGNEGAMYTLRSMTLHCADISNQAKPMFVAQQWTHRCLREFFAQGDAEEKYGLPISPLCDRKTINIPDSQAGFIEFIVRPSFQLYAALVSRAQTVCVSQLDANFRVWKEGRGYADLDHSPAGFAPVGLEMDVLSDESDEVVPELPIRMPRAPSAAPTRSFKHREVGVLAYATTQRGQTISFL